MEKHAYGERERLAGSQRLWSSGSVCIKPKCLSSYLSYSMEVSLQIHVTLPGIITYSSSEIPILWLCKSSLLSSCLSFLSFALFLSLLKKPITLISCSVFLFWKRNCSCSVWRSEGSWNQSETACLLPDLFSFYRSRCARKFLPLISSGRWAGM